MKIASNTFHKIGHQSQGFLLNWTFSQKLQLRHEFSQTLCPTCRSSFSEPLWHRWGFPNAWLRMVGLSTQEIYGASRRNALSSRKRTRISQSHQTAAWESAQVPNLKWMLDHVRSFIHVVLVISFSICMVSNVCPWCVTE